MTAFGPKVDEENPGEEPGGSSGWEYDAGCPLRGGSHLPGQGLNEKNEKRNHRLARGLVKRRVSTSIHNFSATIEKATMLKSGHEKFRDGLDASERPLEKGMDLKSKSVLREEMMGRGKDKVRGQNNDH